MPRGQKSDPEVIERAIELAQGGMSLRRACAAVGGELSPSTLSREMHARDVVTVNRPSGGRRPTHVDAAERRADAVGELVSVDDSDVPDPPSTLPVGLTQESAAVVLRCCAKGMTVELSAVRAGLRRRTALEWIAKGDADPESVWGTWLTAVLQTRAACVERFHDTLAAGSVGYQAVAWLLERIFREEGYGRRLELDAQVASPLSEVSTETLIDIARAFVEGRDEHR